MSAPRSAPEVQSGPDMGAVMRRNVALMRERREAAAQAAPLSHRVAQRITDFAGSMTFVLIHLFFFGAWIGVNLLGPEPWRFDPSMVVLAMVASVEAIFISTFVLISQNRMAAAEHDRAELDLQINLLAEHEITRLIDLVSRMARHAGVPADDPDLNELRRDVSPGVVLDEISQSNEEDNE